MRIPDSKYIFEMHRNKMILDELEGKRAMLESNPRKGNSNVAGGDDKAGASGLAASATCDTVPDHFCFPLKNSKKNERK